MTRDPYLDKLADLWREHDPVPPGLVERMQLLARAEADLAATDWDYELMLLVERSEELAGARSGGTSVTLHFSSDDLDVLLRTVDNGDSPETRLDGWVLPASQLTVRLTPVLGDAAGWVATVDETGRFELPRVPTGLYRLWVEGPESQVFGTSAFEI